MKSEEDKIRRDITILELMIIKIRKYQKYQNDFVHVHYIIDTLEGLLNQLEFLDKNWKTNFRTIWLEIEICYASCLSEDLEKLSDIDEKIIEESLNELEKIIIEKMKELNKLVPEQNEDFF